jgi:hypothetical protein
MSNIELLKKMDLLAPPEEGISQVGGVFKSVEEAMAFMAKMKAGTREMTEAGHTKRKRVEKLSDGEALELHEGAKVLAERAGDFVEAEVVKESKKAGFWACRFDDGKLLPRSPAQMKSPFKKNTQTQNAQPEIMKIRIRRRTK